jgi:hypothetical protein
VVAEAEAEAEAAVHGLNLQGRIGEKRRERERGVKV